MAGYSDHRDQAQHNEELCKIFVNAKNADLLNRYYDWLVTITFYAAIHYVEADFFMDSDIEHTETSKPSKTSEHTHRQNLVRRKYGKKCWNSYRKLRNASRIARYLKLTEVGIATNHIELKDAKNFFERDLKIIKRATNFADR